MSLKHEVLSYLEKNRGQTFSGQELAEEFSVSRAAIWKWVKALREEGHQIEAVQNKGYRLAADSDVLSAEGIAAFLRNSDVAPEIFVYETVDSTNAVTKQMAIDGGADGTVVLANHQTAGRGRMGRSFYSPQDTGIYLSLLLRPSFSVEDSLRVTVGVAVALCNAIEKFSDKKAEIKWVNDIFIEGKKVCGILTEAVTNFESGTIDSIIIGVGINVKTQSFPQELQNIAGSVFPCCLCRNELAAEVIKEIFHVLPHLKDAALMEDYRRRSFLLGKEIIFTQGKEEVHGIAFDINDDGNLLVRRGNGEITALQWGEVRVAVK